MNDTENTYPDDEYEDGIPQPLDNGLDDTESEADYSDVSSELSPKVTLPLAAGAAVTVLAWVLVETTGTELPPPVGAAITTIVMATVGYLKRDPSRG